MPEVIHGCLCCTVEALPSALPELLSRGQMPILCVVRTALALPPGRPRAGAWGSSAYRTRLATARLLPPKRCGRRKCRPHTHQRAARAALARLVVARGAL